MIGRIHLPLADAHELFRHTLAEVLASDPAIIIDGEAADGRAAVQLALRLKPDVVLMDFNMPQLTGLDATRIIHELAPGVHIIGLSMHDSPELIRAMRDAGADAILTKDTDVRHITDCIRRCVDDDQRLEQASA